MRDRGWGRGGSLHVLGRGRAYVSVEAEAYDAYGYEEHAERVEPSTLRWARG